MRLKYYILKVARLIVVSVLTWMVLLEWVYAQNQYLVKSGDMLSISVWKEPDLTQEVSVSPDGTFTVPLIGVIQASNRPLTDIQKDVTKSLVRYIPEAIVTIGLKESVGTKIYVIGQVNTAGVFVVKQPTDVMQALSLAQGMSAYAAQNKIRILRRNKNEQVAIPFRYGDVVKGHNLDQNIILKNGDVVVVP